MMMTTSTHKLGEEFAADAAVCIAQVVDGRRVIAEPLNVGRDALKVRQRFLTYAYAQIAHTK